MLAIGVKQAKSDLSKLIEAALSGERVVITNHGKAAVRLVPEAPEPAKDRGIGCLKTVGAYPHHWFSAEGEAAFAALFEGLSPALRDKAGRTKAAETKPGSRGLGK